MGVSTDPIADALTAIRNAGHARKEKVDVSASKLAEQLLRLLREEGFIRDYKPLAEGPRLKLRVYLKYLDGRVSAITHVRRISKPGLRIYRGKAELKPVRGGLGLAIVSTSKGVMTDEQARKIGVGGEVLCQVW